MFYGCKRWSGCDGSRGRAGVRLASGCCAGQPNRRGRCRGPDVSGVQFRRRSRGDDAVGPVRCEVVPGVSSARGCESLQMLDSMIMISVSGPADRVTRRVGSQPWRLRVLRCALRAGGGEHQDTALVTASSLARCRAQTLRCGSGSRPHRTPPRPEQVAAPAASTSAGHSTVAAASVRQGLHRPSSSAGPTRKVRQPHSPQEPRGGPSTLR